MECTASLDCKPIAKEFDNDREPQGATITETPLKRRSSYGQLLCALLDCLSLFYLSKIMYCSSESVRFPSFEAMKGIGLFLFSAEISMFYG